MADLEKLFYQTTEYVIHRPTFKWIFQKFNLIFRGAYDKTYKSEEFTLADTNQVCSAMLKFNIKSSSKFTLRISPYKDPVKLLVSVLIMDKNSKKCLINVCTADAHADHCDINIDLPSINDYYSRNFIVNNNLTVLCELRKLKEFQVQKNIVTSAHEILPYKLKATIKGFSSLYKSKQLCDVTFRIGNSVIQAHTLVLKAVSPYFLAMFSNNGMKEQTERVVDLADDVDITEEIFQNFLDYIYGVKCLEELGSNVPQMLVLADKYNMMKMKNLCEMFLRDTLNKDNVVSNLLFAIKYDFKLLKDRCVVVAKNCMQEIKNSKEFQELLLEHSNLGYELL